MWLRLLMSPAPYARSYAGTHAIQPESAIHHQDGWASEARADTWRWALSVASVLLLPLPLHVSRHGSLYLQAASSLSKYLFMDPGVGIYSAVLRLYWVSSPYNTMYLLSPLPPFFFSFFQVNVSNAAIINAIHHFRRLKSFLTLDQCTTAPLILKIR